MELFSIAQMVITLATKVRTPWTFTSRLNLLIVHSCFRRELVDQKKRPGESCNYSEKAVEFSEPAVYFLAGDEGVVLRAVFCLVIAKDVRRKLVHII